MDISPWRIDWEIIQRVTNNFADENRLDSDQPTMCYAGVFPEEGTACAVGISHAKQGEVRLLIMCANQIPGVARLIGWGSAPDGRLAVVTELLEQRLDRRIQVRVLADMLCNNNNRTPLHLSSMQGLTGMCRLLLKHNANIGSEDNDGYMPLHLSSVQGHTET